MPRPRAIGITNDGAGGYDMVDGESSFPSGSPAVSISDKSLTNPEPIYAASPSALWQPRSPAASAIRIGHPPQRRVVREYGYE